jgi:hypothetical protein
MQPSFSSPLGVPLRSSWDRLLLVRCDRMRTWIPFTSKRQSSVTRPHGRAKSRLLRSCRTKRDVGSNRKHRSTNSGCMMPPKAKLDALHVASAVLSGVEYLLTQNCRHIANATELPRLYRLLEDLQLPRILICTPAQFLGDPDDDI